MERVPTARAWSRWSWTSIPRLKTEVVALMDKPHRRRTGIEADYVGFKIPNKFVVGYGVDFAERFRNLSYVGYIEEPQAKG